MEENRNKSRSLYLAVILKAVCLSKGDNSYDTRNKEISKRTTAKTIQ